MREEDEALAVGFEAGDVGIEGFGGEVGAARVDADADCSGKFAWDACFLKVDDALVVVCLEFVVVMG